MSAFVKINSSTFEIKNARAFRARPEEEFKHRLLTRAHLAYLRDEKLFDVSDARWAKQTDSNGEVSYGHEYEGCIFVVRLKTANGRFDLRHNEDGAFDRHLLDNPGETVYSITSLNNGLESTHTFSATNAGMASVPIIGLFIALTVSLANGLATAEAVLTAGGTVAAIWGVNVTTIPVVGMVLAVLGFIGVWIAYLVGREITLNLIYENRSKETITLVDHAVYNIGDNKIGIPATLEPLREEGDYERYDDVVICIDNNDKYRGVGVSMKFQKKDGSSLAICIRQDIYKKPHYTIVPLTKDDQRSAQQVYDACTSGDLVTEDFPWGSDLIVKNCLDPAGFLDYKFAGIFSFNDVAQA